MFSPRVLNLALLAALFAVAVAVYGCLSTMAAAHDEVRGIHGQGHHRLHHWYSKLMRPDWPASSCCNNKDCTPTRAEKRGDAWWAMRNGVWVEVPASKINAEESVDTQAHICFPEHSETEIYCFVKPGLGI